MIKKILAHHSSFAINKTELQLRTKLVLCWLLLLAGALCCLFWYIDWQYNLPAPIPSGNIPLNPGRIGIVMPGQLGQKTQTPLSGIHYTAEEFCDQSASRMPVNIDRYIALLLGYYYGGNDNPNRYCKYEHTNYALKFGAMALDAYGCQAPGGTQQGRDE